ncbi:MAG: DUF4091 domain-containing protein [Candidatus Hydrogenedentes bacterium]|nr:DUF4091 domain-containing protein [Candidatus Hydrogenedentota bacterium]
MSLPLLFILFTTGATDVWTESSMTKVFPSTVPAADAMESIRIYAARGENESFQVCIRAGKKPVEDVQLRAGALNKQIGPPAIRRVAYATAPSPSDRVSSKTQTLWPDPLLEPEPFDVPARETRALWVTYEIPRNTKAGIYTGALDLTFGKSPKRPISVTIEVFDFEIPETPKLASLFPLDRLAISDFYGISGNALEVWKPIYDALAPYPVSLALAANGDLLRVAQDGAADCASFQEHIDYVANHAHMTTIELGLGERGISLFPEPRSPSEPEPLRAYLRGMADWLADRHWLDKACVSVTSVPDRLHWPDARNALERVQRADPRPRRLVRGGLHPYWERYTDIWAVPLAGLDPTAAQRLVQGQSLATPPAYTALSMDASSSGAATGAGWETTPADAYDGSPYTCWRSANSPSTSTPEWLRLDFTDVVKLSSLSVLWEPGSEASGIRLETSFDGRLFSSATTRWEGHNATGPNSLAWSEGVLAMEKPTFAIRLIFSKTVSGGPVGVREIIAGKPNENAPATQIQAPELWLSLNSTDFPSLSLDAASAEFRLVPWVCWQRGFAGLTGSQFNRWPRTWAQTFKNSAVEWKHADSGSGVLMYPGLHGPFPSIRLEVLRDGMEDYEYLCALTNAVSDGRAPEDESRDLLPAARYGPRPSQDKIKDWAMEAQRNRVRIGRALTETAKGPRP